MYTTKEPDYQKYLAYGGLKLEEGGTIPGRSAGPRNLVLIRIGTPDPLQAMLLICRGDLFSAALDLPIHIFCREPTHDHDQIRP